MSHENGNGTNLATVPAEVNFDISIYNGASTLKITEEEQKKLQDTFPPEQIEIRPDGMIYLPQTFWRKRLNDAFGIGQWCLIEIGSHKDPNPQKDKLYVKGALLVRGSFVALAVGEAELHSTNSNQSWASVWESAKSDCITRCCKDLGIASELWQPTFIREWIAANAVMVYLKKRNANDQNEKVKTAWRKKNAKPFWNENTNNNQSAPPQQPPQQNPYNKTYADAKAIEGVLAIVQTKADLNALYKANDKIVGSNPELQKKFLAAQEGFKNKAAKVEQQVAQPAPAQQNTGKQKPPLTPHLLKQLIERLEGGDVSVYDQAFANYSINDAQKQLLDDAHRAANEFEVRIRVKYHRAEDIEILLGLCTNVGQVRAMHEANADLINKHSSLVALVNQRGNELSQKTKK